MADPEITETSARQGDERATNRVPLIWGTALVIVALGAIALWFGL
ncbi:hypothetical protein [Afifella sp. IM 167]|nr:hypothetical protein [Afifella sp. IM 167]